MAKNSKTTLRLPPIKGVDDVLAWLRDELNWPIPEDAFAEDLTFDWENKELRLSDDTARRLKEGRIQQLRPFKGGQQWGIFFVEFEHPNIYRTALRQILRGLVPNRMRASSSKAWRHDDLLFICLTKGGADITFAHFRGESHHRAKLATFGWEAGSPFVRTLLEHNLPKLEWPDDPADNAAWQKQWASAFDKEALTREFFQILKRLYDDFIVPEIRKGLKDDAKAAQAGLVLLNRLLFLYFIQKKGWLDGKANYLLEAFKSYRAEPKKCSFYAGFLQLLFEALAMPKTDRRTELIPFKRVPFLNGGLFESEATLTGEDLKVSNETFARLFDELLERHNFTVTEDTPLDVEVAVDPEMLGKIFEELVTGRHESGAYYTPRPVVSFMCREALKGYLGGGEAIEKFVDEHDASGLKNPEEVLAKLRDLRACDPACGSGAYLVGLLHELVALRRCLFASRHVDPTDHYERKLQIIQNCLYGVDMDPIAIHLARLRLWLTLSIEFEGPNPPPLPNLDFKIERNDSVTGPDPSGGPVPDMFRRQQIEDFENLKAEYARRNIHGDKTELRKEIEAMRLDIARWAHPGLKVEGFDWRVEFAEVFARDDAPGFDIVLANPPYLSTKHGFGRDCKGLLKSLYSTAVGQYDAYAIFLERALQILSPKGYLAFIVPKPILTNINMAPIRQLLSSHTLVALADPGRVFDAVVESIIILAEKGAPPRSTLKVFKDDDFLVGLPQGRHIRVDEVITSVGTWNLNPSPQPRAMLDGTSKILALGELVNIHRGIECGKHDECIYHFPRKGGHPLLRGEDVRRYSIDFKNVCVVRTADEKKFKPLEIYGVEKLLVRRVGNDLMAAVDREGFHALNTLYILTLRRGCPVSLDFLCAALNSSALNGIFHQLFMNDDKIFPYIRKSQLEQLPIRIPGNGERDKITRLAAKRAAESGASGIVEREIECIFSGIYGTSNVIEVSQKERV